MPPPLEIPGYYYDAEKRKYFKIQKPSSGASAAAAYSSDNVKRRKLQDEADVKTRRIKAKLQHHIRPSPVLRDPLLAPFLRRECGGGRIREHAAIVLAQGMEPLEILRQRPGPSISAFDVDPQSRTLMTTCARNTVHALPPTFAALGCSTDEEPGMPPSYMWPYHFPVTARQEDVTSITIDPISRTLLTSWHSPTFNLTKLGEGPFARAYSGFGSQGSYCFSILPPIFKYRTDKYHVDMATRRRMIVVIPCGKRMCPSFASLTVVHSYFSVPYDKSDLSKGADIFFTMGDEDIWTSTAAPRGSSFRFAVGGTGRLSLVDISNDGIRLRQQKTKEGAILALSFLSDSPTSLLTGSRSGLLRRLDVRQRFTDSNNSEVTQDSDWIKHASGITHIKQVDSNRIIVAGFDSSLCQYDLRYCAQEDRVPRTSGRPGQSRTKACTRPVLTYSEYRNSGYRDIGFDIDVSSRLVAAAHDDCTVQLYSLYSGERVETRLSKEKHPEVVKALRFMDDIKGDASSLYVASGSSMRRYAW